MILNIAFLKNDIVWHAADFFNVVFTQRSRGYLVLVPYLKVPQDFEMVNHQLLINTLSSYGLKEPLLAWIDSFLRQQQKVAKINLFFSNSVLVKSGVVRGSKLVPLLLLVFINDICE